MDINTDATATAAPAVEDRFEVETNVVPEAKPEKVEAEKDKTTEEKTPDTEPKVEPTEPKPINPRTAQRKAEKERLIRENAAMAERLRQLEQERAPVSEQPKARDSSKEPQLSDYDDVLEYTEARAEWRANQVYESRTSQAELQKQTAALAERAEAVRAEKPDFDEKIGAVLHSQLVTPDIEKAILASPVGADIMYHLANYGADLMTLRGYPAEALPQAIKEIESFIKNGGQPEKPKITKASPPITPPGVSANTGRSLSSYTQEELENMPLIEYKRLSNMK